MIVKNTVSSLWLSPAPDARSRLAAILDTVPPGTEIFFRADDIGVPSDKCRKMMKLFKHHGVPLHMAVTPAWLTPSRWNTLREWDKDSGLFVWHQHGWRHVSHQQTGKKGEFGSDRPWTDKRDDLAKGMDRLGTIMGNDFCPWFTPPWNRFDAETGVILADLGFKGVSRSGGEQKKVPLPETLPDVFVNVDLHTRGETDPAEGWDELMDEFAEAADTGRMGVMLHHQRMNDAAFDFLNDCLAEAASRAGLEKLALDLL